MRAPEAPSGWPSETAPPYTLVWAAVIPSKSTLTRPTTLKASLSSKKSMSLTEIPARLAARGTALAGAVVNHSGSWAASAEPAIRARGLRPSWAAFSSDIRTSAAAPSLRVEALAAVTVPSLVKAGRSELTLSRMRLLYSSSWATCTTLPLRSLTSTGTTSRSNLPAAHAAALRS